jgi:hypothetical protein
VCAVDAGAPDASADAADVDGGSDAEAIGDASAADAYVFVSIGCPGEIFTDAPDGALIPPPFCPPGPGTAATFRWQGCFYTACSPTDDASCVRCDCDSDGGWNCTTQ